MGNIVLGNALVRAQAEAQDSPIRVDQKGFCQRFAIFELQVIQQLHDSQGIIVLPSFQIGSSAQLAV